MRRVFIVVSLMMALAPKVSFSAPSNLKYKVGERESVSRILEALNLGPIYGNKNLLRKTLKLNSNRLKKGGNFVLPGTELVLPIAKLPPSDNYWVADGFVYFKHFPKKGEIPSQTISSDEPPTPIPTVTPTPEAPPFSPEYDTSVAPAQPMPSEVGKPNPPSEPFVMPFAFEPHGELKLSGGAETFTASLSMDDKVVSGDVETPRSYAVPVVGVDLLLPLVKMTHKAQVPSQFGLLFSANAAYQFTTEKPKLGPAFGAFSYGFIRWVNDQTFELNTGAGYGVERKSQLAIDATSPTTDENGDAVDPLTTDLQTQYRGPAFFLKLRYQKFSLDTRYFKVTGGKASQTGFSWLVAKGSQLTFQLSADEVLPFELGVWIRYERNQLSFTDSAGKSGRTTFAGGVSRAVELY